MERRQKLKLEERSRRRVFRGERKHKKNKTDGEE